MKIINVHVHMITFIALVISFVSIQSFANEVICTEASDTEFAEYFDHSSKWIRVNPNTFELYSSIIRFELHLDFQNRSNSLIKAFGFTKGGLGIICKTNDKTKLIFFTETGLTRVDVTKTSSGLLTATYEGSEYYFAPENKIE